VVQARALGSNVRVDTVQLTAAAGVMLRLPVSPHPVDACEGFMVVVDSNGRAPR
jgi:hypothetical protein